MEHTFYSEYLQSFTAFPIKAVPLKHYLPKNTNHPVIKSIMKKHKNDQCLFDCCQKHLKKQYFSHSNWNMSDETMKISTGVFPVNIPVIYYIEGCAENNKNNCFTLPQSQSDPVTPISTGDITISTSGIYSKNVENDLFNRNNCLTLTKIQSAPISPSSTRDFSVTVNKVEDSCLTTPQSQSLIAPFNPNPMPICLSQKQIETLQWELLRNRALLNKKKRCRKFTNTDGEEVSSSGKKDKTVFDNKNKNQNIIPTVKQSYEYKNHIIQGANGAKRIKAMGIWTTDGGIDRFTVSSVGPSHLVLKTNPMINTEKSTRINSEKIPPNKNEAVNNPTTTNLEHNIPKNCSFANFNNGNRNPDFNAVDLSSRGQTTPTWDYNMVKNGNKLLDFNNGTDHRPYICKSESYQMDLNGSDNYPDIIYEHFPESKVIQTPLEQISSSPPTHPFYDYKHILLVQKSVQSYMCQGCNKSLESESELPQHLLCTNIKNTIQCDICQLQVNKEEYSNHLKEHVENIQKLMTQQWN